MDIYGPLWIFMGIYGYFWVFNGYFLDLYGYLMDL